jgi:lipopolysaccharide/colanic/teichoic acid biosynthesis glycosyltransferase/nucleoside-diphosphate-sugar epimerase
MPENQGDIARILVTGANGFIGKALCASLRQNYRVRMAVRRGVVDASLDVPSGLEVAIVGDINSRTDWSRALGNVDIVIHLAARVHVMRETERDPYSAFHEVNVAGSERLAHMAASHGVRRLVYVSSIKVNGEHTESSPFAEGDSPNPQDSYGVSKYEAELALQVVAQETGLEVVIVRPPLVYGPGVGGNFLRLLKLVSRRVPLPLASVHNRRSMIYLENFVDVLATCAIHPLAAGKTFLVSDGEDVSTANLIRELARLMGKPSCLWTFSPTSLRLAGRVCNKSGEIERLLGSLVIDSSYVQTQLDWAPPFSMAQGLAETVGWFLEQDNDQGHISFVGRRRSYKGKRILDFLFAALGMFVFSVPMIVIALLVKLTSKGPVLYWSNRVGSRNRIFRMPKFRTMRNDTPAVATHLLKRPEEYLTPIGGFLRKTSLDELPQIWSILRGDMSIVGPRPALYNQEDLISLRTEHGVDLLVPGLTGWAQVNGRDDLPIQEKVRYDTEYLHRMSFKFDLKILLLTASKVALRTGVSH